MPYNLPPPWDPGYALPQNAKDEGIERQAFVTKEMPNGTYYQSSVGYGGYAVPQYIKDEGYGQGTITTKWLPGGTITTPPVPHWQNQRPQVVSETRMKGGGRRIKIKRIQQPVIGSPADYPVQQLSPQGVGDVGSFVSDNAGLIAAGVAAYFLLRKKK